MKKLLLFILFFQSFIINAQTFAEYFIEDVDPEDWISGSLVTPDSGLILYGGNISTSSSRLLKIDHSGNLVWAKGIDDSLNISQGEIQNFGNEFLVSGIATGLSANRGVVLSLIDSSGSTINSFRYRFNTQAGVSGTNRNLYSVVTSDKHVFAAFFTGLSSGGNFHLTVCYLDSNLNLLWGKTLGSTTSNAGQSITASITGDGNFIVANDIIDSIYSAIQYIKIDTTGNVLWSTNVDFGTYKAKPFDILASMYGDNIVSGTIDANCFIGRIDNFGNFRLLKILVDLKDQYEPLIKESETGNIGIIYNHNSASTQVVFPCYALMDSGGVIQTAFEYAANCEFSSIDNNLNGGWYLTGHHFQTSPPYFLGLYVLNVDSSGIINCNEAAVNIISSTLPFSVTGSYWDSVATTNRVQAYSTISPVAFHTENCTWTKLDKLKESQINIYPNPAHDYLQIDLNDNIDTREFQLLDVLGKKQEIDIWKTGDGKYRMSLSDLNAGIYFLSIKTGNSIVIRKLFLNK